MAGFFELGAQAGNIVNGDRDVRLERRPEVGIDAEMQLPVTQLQPATLALELSRFRNLDQPEQIAEEVPDFGFAAGGYGDLDMIQFHVRPC